MDRTRTELPHSLMCTSHYTCVYALLLLCSQSVTAIVTDDPVCACYVSIVQYRYASAQRVLAWFPAYPGETPSKSELVKWLDSWSDSLETAGFSPLLRGEIPFEIRKLAPRELSKPTIFGNSPRGKSGHQLDFHRLELSIYW